MATQRVQMKEVVPWFGFVGLVVPARYKRLLSCLGCSGQPSTKYFFFSPYTINGDSKSTKARVLPWFRFVGLVVPVQETFIPPSTKYFFSLTVHFFNLCVPIAQQPGQAVVQGRPSLNVCLRYPYEPSQYKNTNLHFPPE
jgi:hypothetical protein